MRKHILILVLHSKLQNNSLECFYIIMAVLKSNCYTAFTKLQFTCSCNMMKKGSSKHFNMVLQITICRKLLIAFITCNMMKKGSSKAQVIISYVQTSPRLSSLTQILNNGNTTSVSSNYLHFVH